MSESLARDELSPGLTPRSDAAAGRRLRRRHRADRRFGRLCLGAVGFAIAFLVFLLGTIVWQGWRGFTETTVTVDVHFDAATLDPTGEGGREALRGANYSTLIRDALERRLDGASGRQGRRDAAELVSSGAELILRSRLLEEPSLLGKSQSVALPVSSPAQRALAGPPSKGTERVLSEQQLAWLGDLRRAGAIDRAFDWGFFTSGDSREAAAAGIAGAAMGSLYLILVTLVLSFPLGVAASIWLEEFAPKNRWTDLVEININNLAAVPSIVFGLLGLAVFLNTFGMPRSAPLVGGLVLTLMTLPTIIVASRAALTSVPQSIRAAALALGATPMQTVMHHVLPNALPGILTGTILGLARALGETAPLLMIGMVAFIVDIPQTPMDPSTALPVQIYLWSDTPERAFVAKTSAAILVLVGFLVLMNLGAVMLRRRSEKSY